MKRFLFILPILFLSGCTQVVTAPIYLTGAVVTTTIDIAGSAVHAVSGSSDKEKEDENEER